ncbi:MAG: type II toxin-antitoxin system HigB family toxin [Paracoccaceae bacterium]|nr:type II toxin-antitoxin system HigB family toxin [Paracoccaceae bacterium]
MNVIAARTFRDFWKEHPQAERPLRVLYNRLALRDWGGPREIKDAFGATVSFVGDNRVIFDVSGNKYRVIIAFAYAYKCGLIKCVGTHAQYDKIDVEKV